MAAVTPRMGLPALWLAVVLAGGCGYFRPADPEPPSGDVVIPNYETPEDVLETISLAVGEKANGLSAYIGGFADTLTDTRGFHAFFDPTTLHRAGQEGWSVPDDWNRIREDNFYSRFVTLSSAPANSEFLLQWQPDPTQGEDEVGAERQVLHRQYQGFAILTSGEEVAIAKGFATLEFVRMTATRWAIVRWQDREDPTADISVGEVCFGHLRLDGSE